MYKIICKYCKEEFEHINHYIKYCSKKCLRTHTKIYGLKTKLICKYCNKEFEHIDKNKIFCSSECRSLQAKKDIPMCDLECKECGKHFTIELRKSENRKCCSMECANKYKSYVKSRECLQCGKIFKPRNNNTKMCSIKCASMHLRKPEIHCLNCDKLFKPFLKTSKFCSRDCDNDYKRKNNLFHTQQILRVKRESLNCGKEMEVYPYRINSNKYCCQECHYEHRGRRIVKCLHCEKEFKVQN